MAVLNDAGVEDVLQHLAGKITEVSFAFNAQAISQSVQCFDYNPKCFRDWVIQMKLGNLLAYRFLKPKLNPYMSHWFKTNCIVMATASVK